jgi:hypothetical protein
MSLTEKSWVAEIVVIAILLVSCRLVDGGEKENGND